MKIVEVKLNNIRGYKDAKIELSPNINLIVGENNSGKTTILRTLHSLQELSLLTLNDVRKNEEQGSIELSFDGDVSKYFYEQISNQVNASNGRLSVFIPKNGRVTVNGNEISEYGIQYLVPNTEPKNFIYPFLSKRKVAGFLENINIEAANSVVGNFSNMSAKVDRINTDGLPAKDEYVQACKEILGFHISSSASANGKKAVYIVNNFDHIPLELMGEGVANILGLILDLCIAENKLFLIEEPENDIHPRALKKLLAFILKKSETNQFVITTHSNIVLKYLGSNQPSKIFNVNMEFVDRIPTSSIVEVDNSPKARREILEDLGYELLDFDVWDAWLIFEESSAEAIIRDFLIPNFTPGLKTRLKTCSSAGVDKVAARFDALQSLCLFLHLQENFHDKIWVLVDGGDKERKIINDLKNKYKSWKQDRFRQFEQHDFESYYPEVFQARVSEVLKIETKDDKRMAKKALLEDIKRWYTQNPDLAKEAFSKSASEVVEILKNIEKSVLAEPNKHQ